MIFIEIILCEAHTNVIPKAVLGRLCFTVYAPILQTYPLTESASDQTLNPHFVGFPVGILSSVTS